MFLLGTNALNKFEGDILFLAQKLEWIAKVMSHDSLLSRQFLSDVPLALSSTGYIHF